MLLEIDNEKISQWRNTFSSSQGIETLIDLLTSCRVFEYSECHEHTIQQNQAIFIMKALGGGEVSRETIREFIKALVRQPLKEKANKTISM
jgi:predicted alpha/beta superfamily hydrolase